MSPQERQEFDNLKRVVTQLQKVEDIVFIESLKRRIVTEAIARAISEVDLEDLRNVSISSPVNGQVLKYDSGVWENGTDNI
jgi:hypothetical protein